MTQTVHAPPSDLPLFSDDAFDALARLARKEFGLNLPESKKSLVHSRLLKRLTACDVKDLDAYVAYVQKECSGEERRHLVSALTTNVTNFFREAHHFETLRTKITEIRRRKAVAGDTVRIWSAGCSKGQEPYSIAITLKNHDPDTAFKGLKLLATDVDSSVLQHAKRGVYDAAETKMLPDNAKQWFTLCNNEPGKVKLSDEILSSVVFADLNLVHAWPFRRSFDVIFCRNVAIYFDKPTQSNLWRRLVDQLEPGGLLFIGHSERLCGPSIDLVSSIGVTSYQKPLNSGPAQDA